MQVLEEKNQFLVHFGSFLTQIPLRHTPYTIHDTPYTRWFPRAVIHYVKDRLFLSELGALGCDQTP